MLRPVFILLILADVGWIIHSTNAKPATYGSVATTDHHTHSTDEAAEKHGFKHDKSALNDSDQSSRDSYGNPVTPYTTLSTADIKLSTVPIAPAKSANRATTAAVESSTSGPHGVIAFKLPSYAGGITQITGPYKEPTGKPSVNVQLPITDLLPPLEVVTVRTDDVATNKDDDDESEKKTTPLNENEIPDSSPTSNKIDDDKSVTEAPSTSTTKGKIDVPLPINDLLPPLIRPNDPQVRKGPVPIISRINIQHTQSPEKIAKPTSVPLTTTTGTTTTKKATTTTSTVATTKRASKDAEHIPLPIDELLPPIEKGPASEKPQIESTSESQTKKPIQKYRGSFGGAPGILGDSNKRGFAVREDGSIDLTGTPLRPATTASKTNKPIETESKIINIERELVPPPPSSVAREPSTELRTDSQTQAKPQIEKIESETLPPPVSSPTPAPSFVSKATTQKPIQKYTGGFGGAPGVFGDSTKRGYAIRNDGSIDSAATPSRPAATRATAQSTTQIASTKPPTTLAATSSSTTTSGTTAPTRAPTHTPHTTKKSLSSFDTTSEQGSRATHPTGSSTQPSQPAQPQFNPFGNSFGNGGQQGQFPHYNGFGVGTSSSASNGPQGSFTSQSHYNYDPSKPFSNNNGFQFGQQFIPNYAQNPFLNVNGAFGQGQGQGQGQSQNENGNVNSQNENAPSINANAAPQSPSNAPTYSQNPFLNPNSAAGQGQNGNANSQSGSAGIANEATRFQQNVPNYSQNPFLNANSASPQRQGQTPGNANEPAQTQPNGPNYSQNPFLNPNSASPQGQGSNNIPNSQNSNAAPGYSQIPFQSPQGQRQNSDTNSQRPNVAAENANEPNAPNFPHQNQGQNNNANSQKERAPPGSANAQSNIPSNGNDPNLNDRIGANEQQPDKGPSSSSNNNRPTPVTNDQNDKPDKQEEKPTKGSPYTGIFGGPEAHAAGVNSDSKPRQPTDQQNGNNDQTNSGNENEKTGNDSNENNRNRPNQPPPTTQKPSTPSTPQPQPSTQSTASPSTPAPTTSTRAPTIPPTRPTQAPPQNNFPHATPFNQPYNPFANNPFFNPQQFPSFAPQFPNFLNRPSNNNGQTAQPTAANANNGNQNQNQPPSNGENSNEAPTPDTPNRTNIPNAPAGAQKPLPAEASPSFAPNNQYMNNPFINPLSVDPFLPPIFNPSSHQSPFQFNNNNPFLRPNNPFDVNNPANSNVNDNQDQSNAANGARFPSQSNNNNNFAHGNQRPQSNAPNNNFAQGNQKPLAQGADAPQPPQIGDNAPQFPFQNNFPNQYYRPQSVPYQGFPSFQPFPGFQFQQPNVDPFLPPVQQNAQHSPATSPNNNNNANADRKAANKYTGGFGGPPGLLKPYDGKGAKHT